MHRQYILLVFSSFAVISANGQQLCAQYATTSVNGDEYIVQNNIWGSCSTNSGMPIVVSNVRSANFTWSATSGVSGSWGVAAEAWLSPSSNSSNGYNGGA